MGFQEATAQRAGVEVAQVLQQNELEPLDLDQDAGAARVVEAVEGLALAAEEALHEEGAAGLPVALVGVVEDEALAPIAHEAEAVAPCLRAQ